MRVILWWTFWQKILWHSVDYRLSSFSPTTRTVFWLNVQNCVKNTFCALSLEAVTENRYFIRSKIAESKWKVRYIGVGMQSERFWSISCWKRWDEVSVRFNCFQILRYIVSPMEAEIWLKHVFFEPRCGESFQQSFVVVISDTSSILNFADHVANGCPLYSLNKQCSSQFDSNVYS